MKVKATVNQGYRDYEKHAMAEGEVNEVPDVVARHMLKRGHAIEVEEQDDSGEQQRKGKGRQ